jgi:hypothetical protein
MKDRAQMSLSEHDQVVDTFPSDRADQSLCVPVLPWRPWRNRLEPVGETPLALKDFFLAQ